MSQMLNATTITAHGRSFTADIARLASAFEDAKKQAQDDTADEFVIPENLSELSDTELTELHAQAIEHFDTLYGDGSGIADSDMQVLSELTDAIETLNAEIANREQAQAERAEKAAELAARVHKDEADANADTADASNVDANAAQAEVTDGATGTAAANGTETAANDANAANGTNPETVVAAAAGATARRIPLSAVRTRQHKQPTPANDTGKPTSMRDVLTAGADLNGYASGEGVTWDDIAKGLDRRLTGFPTSQYANAQQRGQHIREQHSVAVLRKPIPEELTVRSADPLHVDEVIKRALDETRLPGGTLVASGGWCAPSEVLYDLVELESNDGIVSLPEIGVARGGVQFTPGPSFADIYSNITGFHYTEAQDRAGNFGVDANGVGNGNTGSKPCYHIPCPTFTEARLEVDGLCLEAGLLQSRGYPEIIARTMRGAIVAHNHRISARTINAMATGSTAVTMPAGQIGATAPILTAIELQVEHYRYTHRLGRNVTLEAIFPYWVHGAIRSDLSRRLGVDLLDVADSRINGWFAARGIAAQFVYDWQALDATTAANTLAWPATVSFLLYAAGTWVRGVNDVITMDTVYDSVLLGENNFTALFTEEGWLVARRGHDSRLVNVNICADGATAGGVLIGCNGAAEAGA